jgi:hypothetical protein
MRAVAVCLLIACRAPALREPSSDESGLRTGHEAILAHHRARDWKAMAGGGVVLDVGNGGIDRITPESGRAHFQRYFVRAEFTRYEDLVPQIVHVSPDGTTGWVIAQVGPDRTQVGSCLNLGPPHREQAPPAIALARLPIAESSRPDFGRDGHRTLRRATPRNLVRAA